jgi:rRNA processing protein Krr1/Pno1
MAEHAKAVRHAVAPEEAFKLVAERELFHAVGVGGLRLDVSRRASTSSSSTKRPRQHRGDVVERARRREAGSSGTTATAARFLSVAAISAAGRISQFAGGLHPRRVAESRSS